MPTAFLCAAAFSNESAYPAQAHSKSGIHDFDSIGNSFGFENTKSTEQISS
jgi:hypothetical protein